LRALYKFEIQLFFYLALHQPIGFSSVAMDYFMESDDNAAPFPTTPKREARDAEKEGETAANEGDSEGPAISPDVRKQLMNSEQKPKEKGKKRATLRLIAFIPLCLFIV
jgi:hypothetical protein